jgi:mevalonate kinase
MTGRGRGRGKLILCGEHAVVYGHPALAFAVDRGTDAVVTAHPGPTQIDTADGDARLADAVATVIPTEGWRVSVRTDLPVGRGMGSSAALAVALVRARAAAQGERPDDDAVFDAAMPVERAFHGNPSGLDVALATRGGLIRFHRGPPRVLRPLPLPSWRVVVLDSGAAGDTAVQVAAVAARRPAIDPVLTRIGDLTEAAERHLHDRAALGEVLDENHACLQAIGVSTPDLDHLVALARRAGAAGAKLAGAGGGGVVLALCEDPGPLLAAAAAAGVVAWATQPTP